MCSSHPKGNINDTYTYIYIYIYIPEPYPKRNGTVWHGKCETGRNGTIGTRQERNETKRKSVTRHITKRNETENERHGSMRNGMKRKTSDTGLRETERNGNGVKRNRARHGRKRKAVWNGKGCSVICAEVQASCGSFYWSTILLMGFIYGIKYFVQGNLPKTYSLTSWLRQQSAINKSQTKQNQGHGWVDSDTQCHWSR